MSRYAAKTSVPVAAHRRNSAPARPDPLDRMEEQWSVLQPASEWARDVLALVRVARAARALTGKPFGQLQQRDFFLLREALAELEADK